MSHFSHIIDFRAWVLLILLLTTTGEAKEPIAAPAELGNIKSPRLVIKSSRPQNKDLLKLVEEAIEISGRRYLVANAHSPWQIYHGLNALRRDFKLELNGELVNAVDWLSTTNPHFRDLPWFEKTIYGGRAHRFTSPYHFEGHPNQSLALMVMCNLPEDHKFKVDGGYITVADIINNAKVDLNPAEEQTWTLWMLAHYLDSDASWMTRRGEMWSMERLVQDQIATQVTKAACGGTHNLYALSVARNNHLRNGGELRGVWMQADQKLKRYMVAAKSLQRTDGSFPTYYFRGYGNPKSFSEQIASSGHIMEWLMVSVDDRQFTEEWVERGIRYIAQKLIDHRDESAECGPLYHAVSALVLYRDRAKGVPWPNPKIQNLESQNSAQPSIVESQTSQQDSLEPGRFPIKTEAPKPLTPSENFLPGSASPNISRKESVSEQAATGKVSIGLSEDEMGLNQRVPDPFELPEQEQLAAPLRKEIVK